MGKIKGWWNTFTLFIRDMNPVIKIAIVSVFILICLVCLMSFIKPSYNVDRNKFKFGSLLTAIVFAGLAAFVLAV